MFSGCFMKVGSKQGMQKSTAWKYADSSRMNLDEWEAMSEMPTHRWALPWNGWNAGCQAVDWFLWDSNGFRSQHEGIRPFDDLPEKHLCSQWVKLQPSIKNCQKRTSEKKAVMYALWMVPLDCSPIRILTVLWGVNILCLWIHQWIEVWEAEPISCDWLAL